jgi:hypothetical protein
MIESYAFLAIFALQICALSVIHPMLLIRYGHAKAADYPPERFPQVGFLGTLSAERFGTIWRAINTSVAAVGVLVLVWLFAYLRDPGHDDRVVPLVNFAYFALQISPLILLFLLGLRYIKALRSLSPEPRRKAVLQRRGLFDFVSPIMVLIAVLTFLLFVAFMIYVSHFHRGPFHGLPGYAMLGFFTLLEISGSFRLHRLLYGKKVLPGETHEQRVNTIGTAVKTHVYSSIATNLFLPVFFTFVLLDLGKWMPLVQSVFFVTLSLLFCFPLTRLTSRQATETQGASI